MNQGLVQQIKNDIRDNGETEEKKQQLEEARNLSANTHNMLQRVLMVTADSLKEALDSEGFQSQDSERVVVDYLTSREMSQRQKEIAKAQMEKKVKRFGCPFILPLTISRPFTRPKKFYI